MRLPFVKMHGLGNDVIIIDERETRYGLGVAEHRRIADRRLGAGCDQILYVEPSTRAHARYRVVNADGSEAEHCGNGVRCVARYLARAGEHANPVAIEINDDVFALELLDGDRVRVDMGVPDFTPAALPFSVDAQRDRYVFDVAGESIELGAVSMGNPHAVLQVTDVASADVARLGPAVQALDEFPRGVNVGFMQIDSTEHATLRVYERGAGETRACGTGACAAMAIGRRWQQLADSVTVTLPGGDLAIEWSGEPGARLSMTGPATFVYEGEFEL